MYVALCSSLGKIDPLPTAPSVYLVGFEETQMSFLHRFNSTLKDLLSLSSGRNNYPKYRPQAQLSLWKTLPFLLEILNRKGSLALIAKLNKVRQVCRATAFTNSSRIM